MLRAVLHKIITRLKKLLTRRDVLVEEQRQWYVADNDSDSTEACGVTIPRQSRGHSGGEPLEAAGAFHTVCASR